MAKYTDRVDPSIQRSFYTPLTHFPARWLGSLYYRWTNNPVDAAIMSIRYPRHVCDWWNLMKKISAFKHSFMSQWKEANIDVLICPVLPFASVKLGNEKNFTGCLTYTALFSLLDYPAGCVPVSEVDKSDIANLKNGQRYKISTKLEQYICEDQLDTKLPSVGLPLGVQVIALPFYDELVLRVMREIEELKQAKASLD
ncbi:hypothetical protein Btru_039301 [Bulinus truncatus]|nr:hypothetical protein Btru_039301 [Bulinus truncatus]